MAVRADASREEISYVIGTVRDHSALLASLGLEKVAGE